MMDFLIPKAYAAYSATSASSDAAFNSLLSKILTNVVNPIIYLVLALAVFYFVWGVFGFIQNAENPTKRIDGYKHMIWGVVGLFIMLSAKGLINIILSTMGLK